MEGQRVIAGPPSIIRCDLVLATFYEPLAKLDDFRTSRLKKRSSKATTRSSSPRISSYIV
eukprot:scaffold2103_cov185-Amphora_coffeaeformis.AAC.33